MEQAEKKKSKNKKLISTNKANKRTKSKTEVNTLISPFINKFGSPITIETKKINKKSTDKKNHLSKQ